MRDLSRVILIMYIICLHWNQLLVYKDFSVTSNKPSRILVVIKNPVPKRVNNGVSNVNTDVAAIPITNTRLPPNLVAKYPPGIWVNIYP